MTDTIDALESASNTYFSDMTRAADGAGVEAQRAWQGVLNAKINFEGDLYYVTSNIEKVIADKNMPEQERSARLQELVGIGESARIAGVKRVLSNIDAFEAALHESQMSDLVLPDAGNRTILRDDIDRLVRRRMESGDSLLSALQNIATSNWTQIRGAMTEVLYRPEFTEARLAIADALEKLGGNDPAPRHAPESYKAPPPPPPVTPPPPPVITDEYPNFGGHK